MQWPKFSTFMLIHSILVLFIGGFNVITTLLRNPSGFNFVMVLLFIVLACVSFSSYRLCKWEEQHVEQLEKEKEKDSLV